MRENNSKMTSTDIIATQSEDYTKTDINGIPAKYVLAKDPNDPTGAASIVVKVIDTDAINIPTPNRRPPVLNPLYNFNDTPLHLQDDSKFIIQHRLGDHSLPYRRINPEHYTHEEMEWYVTGKIPAHLMSICMTYAKKCYLCGDFQENQEDMRFESSGQHPYGYKFCKDCEPYFRHDMRGRLKLSCIWELRLAYEEWCNFVRSPEYESTISISMHASALCRPFVWVNRTRRDENGQRDMVSNRPYKYTKWRIIDWVPKKFEMVHYDEKIKEVIRGEEYGVVVEQLDDEEQPNSMNEEYMSLTKIVPIYDILAINFDLKTNTLKNLSTYDPNEDDPLNKYTYDEKIQEMERMQYRPEQCHRLGEHDGRSLLSQKIETFKAH